jgi:predicted dithiol-disulfide oxidoreductase (DUF899 family)
VEVRGATADPALGAPRSEVNRESPQRKEIRRMKTETPTPIHTVVSREEWLEARKALIAKEKELTRLRDRLAAERRALPWVRVEKQYVFDASQGKVTLADLFDGRSQLFIKHFMMAPGQVGQCVGCSLEVDHLEGVLVHLQNHDVTYAVVARAPIQEIEAVRQRMGWRFTWVSSYHSDFNYDFHVSFTAEEIAAGRALYNYEYVNPGLEDRSGDSVFFKDDAGRIFHTYSTFGRQRALPPAGLRVRRPSVSGGVRGSRRGLSIRTAAVRPTDEGLWRAVGFVRPHRPKGEPTWPIASCFLESSCGSSTFPGTPRRHRHSTAVFQRVGQQRSRGHGSSFDRVPANRDAGRGPGRRAPATGCEKPKELCPDGYHQQGRSRTYNLIDTARCR